jgi:hypothetical protein
LKALCSLKEGFVPGSLQEKKLSASVRGKVSRNAKNDLGTLTV